MEHGNIIKWVIMISIYANEQHREEETISADIGSSQQYEIAVRRIDTFLCIENCRL